MTMNLDHEELHRLLATLAESDIQEFRLEGEDFCLEIKRNLGPSSDAIVSPKKISTEEIAKLTLKCLKDSVPTEVPGIAFLSGGQTENEATENLNSINKHNKTNFIMTYSYGRALQQSALKFWSKNTKDIKGTQATFNHRANMCSLAAQGKWSQDIEKQDS